jgi:hypothetical protein
MERGVLGIVSAVALALAFAYGLNTDRLPVFDERGLDNPIYEYLHTGRMAYPAYGYPDAMVVHPPTHYYVAAQFMRLGFPLLSATVLPVLFFAVLSTFLVVTGRFRFPVALSLMLAQFCGVFIWSRMVTVRPELHLGIAWFTGLIALQAAQNCAWSPWRLFLGAAVCTYAGMLHYWATPAFLAVFVYAVPLLFERPRPRLKSQLWAIGLGGGLVGGLYLALFVMPHFSEIVAFTSEVQSQGSGWHDALSRHREAYQNFASRLFSEPTSAPLGLPAPRWFIDALLTPLFKWRIPAVFVFVPALLLWKDTRLMGVAGSIVPLFVLFYSQGKPIAYTGYFLPEILMYLFACLSIITAALSLVSRAARSATVGHAIRGAAALATAACCFVQVPFTMGTDWRFGVQDDFFDLFRAAAFDIVGPDSTIAITSVPSWYLGGGAVVWLAGNALISANPDSDANRQLTGKRTFAPVRELLAPFDAVISDPVVWWINWSRGAPLNDWYAGGLLQLRGFVFRVRNGRPRIAELLYTVPTDDLPVKGYLIEDDRTLRFVERPAGERDVGEALWLAVFTCSRQPILPDEDGRVAYTFASRTEPEPSAPHLLFVAVRPELYPGVSSEIDSYCQERDVIRGGLVEASAESLKSQLRAHDGYIRIVSDRCAALSAKLTATPGVTLGEWSSEKLENELGQMQYGTPRAPLLRRSSRDALMFVPSTPQDHVALPFVAVKGMASDCTMEVVARNSSVSEGPCTATLQDQELNSLATLKCDGAGVHRAFGSITQNVEKVRVVFVNPNGRPMDLPDTIAVVDHSGEPEGAAPRGQ